MTLWKRRLYRFLACLLGGLLLPAASSTPRNGNADIPALLQFAEQYSEKSYPAEKAPVARDRPRTEKRPTQSAEKGKPDKKPPPQREIWRIKDKAIQQQRTEIAQLKLQITRLQQNAVTATATATATPDWAALSQLAQSLRQALGMTPTERQAKANLLQIQQRWDQDRAVLQQQLSKAKAENQALSAAANHQKNLLMEVEKRDAVLQEQQAELQSQRQLMQTELDETVKKLADTRADMVSLQARSPRLVTADALKDAQPREDYAAGVSLGEEILQMQEERHRWGANSEKGMILAGIADAFAGKRMLSDDELNNTLTTAEKKVAAAREKINVTQRQKGAAYIEEFKKDKRVHQALSGFWYRIDYAGDAQIPATASVDVVVKETLVDGTVVQDMEATGATLSQPVTDFPPLFKEAISLLKNHGTMTLVVPPEQAYGEKGYPPKVPPNATMIYTLRIAEMYPPAQAKTQL
ncbi:MULTISPECIES: FKBP-type peptidyl-prolyl cis-trans isomerase N-terminal domain-containing protein [unclassified Serratia (in: enterobacteria)]|uniref:FKBP-type peptidyl-prolyl cis-trans isomerase N-terminal domain-containing protein n=1 Tax=unclassified Serratia (in: enterobacteria) TaxID=2647522 RepID=UPI0021193BA3|nr:MULTISPECIES: FKBP-type peptidyl-prolyl cis-trans isomerase N-terminal domain-containing protein [unclassified Serratia (in: enterobacteria)]